MKMQINTPKAMAEKIAELSARMIAAGVKRQQARPGKIYARLVEYGTKKWSEILPTPKELPTDLTGGCQNQVEFHQDTRNVVFFIAGYYDIPQREAANACAWWGLPGFLIWLERLEAEYRPRPPRKVGRPRKERV